VELTGFEPVTPALRKMWSKRCDQELLRVTAGLWGSCGASDVIPSETPDVRDVACAAPVHDGNTISGRWATTLGAQVRWNTPPARRPMGPNVW